MNRVWKVFTSSRDYMYCYSKEDALEKRLYWQRLGITGVMIRLEKG